MAIVGMGLQSIGNYPMNSSEMAVNGIANRGINCRPTLHVTYGAEWKMELLSKRASLAFFKGMQFIQDELHKFPEHELTGQSKLSENLEFLVN